MPASFHKRALGQTELLLVLSTTIMLGVMILNFSAQVTRTQKRTQCVANLKSICVAAATYAIDDKRELLIPIHERMLRPSTEWYWKTIHAFSYGGDSAKRKFPSDDDGGVYLNDKKGQGAGTTGAAYARRTRPLNAYITDKSDEEDVAKALNVFHCPSDSGYPKKSELPYAPAAAAGIDCFDILGNSYRANLYALYRDNGEALSLGPWGLRLSLIHSPADTVAFTDPQVFDFAWASRAAPTAQPEPADADSEPRRKPNRAADTKQPKGWHGEAGGDVAAFVDGHVSILKSITHRAPAGGFTSLGSENARLLLRGDDWKFDTFPSPTTAILGEWTGESKVPPPNADVRSDQWPLVGVRALKPPGP